MHLKCVVLALFATLLAPAAPAQGLGLPDPSPELRRKEQRQDDLRRQLEPSPTVRLPGGSEQSPTRLPDNEPLCRTIHSVRLEGMAYAQPAVVRALAGGDLNDPPQDRCLGATGVQVLMERARNALIAQGYVTSRAEAPDQDLRQGQLILRLVPGSVMRIEPAEGSDPPPSLAPVAVGDPLNLRALEQGLENLRRLPGADLEVQLSPGERTDATDLLVRYVKPRPLGLLLSLDDAGSSATGKYLGQASLSWHGPLGMSDLAYLSVSQDAGRRRWATRGNDSQTLHYSIPWGYWLWSVTASRSDYHQTVAGAFQSYLYSGQTQSHDLQLGRVVHRDSASKTSLRLKSFSRESRNFIDDAEVKVQQRRTAGWEAGLQHARQSGRLTVDLDLAFKRGTGAFGALRAPEELFGEGSSRMQIGIAGLNLQWPWGEVGGPVLSHTLRMQLNRTPLSPPDRLCLGGRSTVRGFDGVQALCGDRGLLWRNDLLIPVRQGPLSLYAALDLGRVGGRSAQDLPQRHMAGYALGLRLLQRLPGRTQLQADFFAGQPIRQPSFLKTASTATGLSLSLGL